MFYNLVPFLASLFSLCSNYIEIPTYALLNTDLFCEDVAIRSVFQVFLVIIPPDYLAIPNIFTTFAPLEPAKPLHNAQTGGSFFIIHT